LEQMPSELQNDGSIQQHITPLTAEVMVFFNNSRPILKDASVRRALVLGTDRRQLARLFDQPVRLASSPLLEGQLGYNRKLVEPSYNFKAADQLLTKDGWIKDSKGMRSKSGQSLAFSLSAQDNMEYSKVARFLQNQWAKLGVKLQVQYFSQDDLQASVISNHDYDAVLYGINIGPDPDVFAYWDSSQASITSQGHLNLSEYKSKTADVAVEAGRTRSSPVIRAVKYKEFLKQWRKDLPALVLYQPNYLYITRGPVFNYDRSADNLGVDRFYNVQDWMIRQKRQTITQYQP
ncbi:MAG TPA: ABC transporter substrate-binding protein, partial [Candidatus Saccharimonadales bacterium]|nr:ABC transporter substrate-binding protein [Candidatus Saccharimonadales bacterium]